MKGVSLLYINGQEAESKTSANTIEEGKNQVVLRMDKKVGRGSSQTVYTSAPYVIDINVTGDEVKVNHPVARSKQEAEAAFRTGTPEWRITQDGNTLQYTQEKLQGRDGFLPYSDVGELVAKHNEQRGITFSGGEVAQVSTAAATTAAVATTAVVSEAPKLEATSKKAPETVTNQNNVEQLKAWYLKASKAERKEFRKWMIDQE
ncbi:hypothetical protein JCM19235_4508 [Vibrio maritimus]|uniref:DUF2057 domain-containing protein n=1 Tax=Vibrio maritimus TaxID=990268 RepID=A0A090S0H2_9VIBR|nr:hypothetical protein JCM19235_4508 [Vibrio maritimus]